MLPGLLFASYVFGADSDDVNPLRFYTGPNNSYLQGTIKAKFAWFDQSNSWFGKSKENLGDSSSDWQESVIHPGVEGRYFSQDSGEVYGRFSMVNANTDGIDAIGSNVEHGSDASRTRVEDAYIGWRSGDLFSSLGQDFIDLSFGRQQYVTGTGFIFYSESSNGKNRAGYWMAERKAAEFTAIARFAYEQLETELLYLESDDNPDFSTKVGGITMDYAVGKIGGIGGGVYHLASDIETRDSMDVYDIRFDLYPFEAFEGFMPLKSVNLEGDYVYEDNDDKLKASGWYLSAGYLWDRATWKPDLSYRYASFEGDNPDSRKSEGFDPLFYGFYDWGYWYQGEILGEYVLGNSNLNTHMLKLNLKPLDAISVNLIYYHFRLDNPEAFGVQSEDFADEWDLTVSWAATANLSLALVGAYADPLSGAKEFTGGDDDWSYGMLYGSLNF